VGRAVASQAVEENGIPKRAHPETFHAGPLGAATHLEGHSAELCHFGHEGHAVALGRRWSSVARILFEAPHGDDVAAAQVIGNSLVDRCRRAFVVSKWGAWQAL